jgi:hypothetical protein
MVANPGELPEGSIFMRRVLSCCMGALVACLLFSTVALAGHNPVDYPLRVHIFMFSGYSHYYRTRSSSSLDAVDGEGRANLYQNGQPRGVDFAYHCGVRLRVSPGFETYMAKWKKQDRVLEILMPKLGGKPGDMDSCELNVTAKEDTVYIRQNGLMNETPAAKYKAWMDAHQYDPEHGKNNPVNPPPAQPVSGQVGSVAGSTH